MPYYKLPYSRVIESESGHIVRFEQDTATYVPTVKALIEKVQMFGGQECDAPGTESEAAESVESAAAKTSKPKPAARG